MISTKKICWLWLGVALAITSWLLFSTYATDEIWWTISNGIDQWLTVSLPCSPASVSNGTVNATTCAITCDPNYTLSNNACTAIVTYTDRGWPPPTPADICLSGDLSPSRYDGLCTGAITTWTIWWNSTWIIPKCSIVWSPFTTELNQGYQYACNLGITSAQRIQEANMEGTLLRAHMAKMMVNYAIKVLGMQANTGALCEFDDVADQSTELKLYIKLSCQLGLMGQNISSFRPNEEVTRAQFGTLLSRALYGTQYEWWVPYYVNHLNALKLAGIMNNISDPELMKEIRGYVMLMLMRADK